MGPTRPQPEIQPPTWQNELAQGFSRLDELFHFLRIDRSLLPSSLEAAELFPFRVPRSFAARMEKGNANDPLLRQVLPSSREFDSDPAFTEDPVGDIAAVAAPGILQKYRGRALLITTGGCAVNCRYCFRRAFPYAEHQMGHRQMERALAYLAADMSIEEVILSGGDPLMLSDARLTELLAALDEIRHLKRLRIHSRMPIVIPARITGKLVTALAGSRLKPIMVVHANHGNELNGEVADSLALLRQVGVLLLNQSVLLRGINDSTEALIDLQQRLVQADVLPYYLHLLDRTVGTTHFHVPEDRALDLLRSLRERLPGYLVPRMVRERAGAAFKIPVENL